MSNSRKLVDHRFRVQRPVNGTGELITKATPNLRNTRRAFLFCIFFAALGISWYQSQAPGGDLGSYRWSEARLSVDDLNNPCVTQAIASRWLCPSTVEKHETSAALRWLGARDHKMSKHSKGLLRLAQGRHAESIDLLESAIDDSPQSEEVWNDLGAALLTRWQNSNDWRDLDASFFALQKSLSLNQDYGRAYFNLALLMEKLAANELAAAAWDNFSNTPDGHLWRSEIEDHQSTLVTPSPAGLGRGAALVCLPRRADEHTRRL